MENLLKIKKQLLAFALGLVMFAFLLIVSKDGNVTAPVMFSLIYLLATMLISFEKRLDIPAFLVASAMAAALIYVRVMLLFNESADYLHFLLPWTETLADARGMSGLGMEIGNYTTPYMTMLWIVAKTGLDPLISVKAFSCVFDVLAAYFAMKCVGLKTDNKAALVLIFAAVLALPTVILNGSYWGQCDSIHSALLIAALYYGIKGESVKSVLSFSFALVFKMQSVFMIAGMAVLLMNSKIRLRHLWILPAVYLGVQIPAIIGGMNVFTAIALPFKMLNSVTYGRLTLNAPTLWSFFEYADYDAFSTPALFIAGAAVLGFIYYVFTVRKRINTPKLYILTAYLSVMIMTFLLPSMHERYYFTADILSVILVFYDRRLWYIPLVTCIGSLVSYMPYLTGATVIEFPIVAAAFCAVIAMSLKTLVCEVGKET